MQSNFSELEYSAKKKLTRRDRFLIEIEAVMSWSDLVEALKQYYPKRARLAADWLGADAASVRRLAVLRSFGCRG